MTDTTIKRLLSAIMLLGLVLVLTAIYLAVFAELHNVMGMGGVKIIAAVAGGGLILLLPAKVFLTLWLMTKNEK